MDPISALALACNIIDLVDKAIKCGKTVVEVYNSVDGLQKVHKAVEDEADNLTKVVDELKFFNSRIPLTTIDTRIQTISVEIVAYSLDLQKLLDKCRSRRPGNIWSASKATFKSFLSSSEIQQLQKKLDTSRKNLNLWISVETRYAKWTSSGEKEIQLTED